MRPRDASSSGRWGPWPTTTGCRTTWPWSWTAPTRGARPGAWRRGWASGWSCRRVPWDYDRELYKRRNEVERLFRRLKGFRRVYTRYDKLDMMYWGFVQFALIVETLQVV